MSKKNSDALRADINSFMADVNKRFDALATDVNALIKRVGNLEENYSAFDAGARLRSSWDPFASSSPGSDSASHPTPIYDRDADYYRRY